MLKLSKEKESDVSLKLYREEMTGKAQAYVEKTLHSENILSKLEQFRTRMGGSYEDLTET